MYIRYEQGVAYEELSLSLVQVLDVDRDRDRDVMTGVPIADLDLQHEVMRGVLLVVHVTVDP